MLQPEKNYEFREKLKKIHPENLLKLSLTPKEDEYVIPKNASFFTDLCDEVSLNAIRDFTDFLSVSMNIQLVRATKKEDASFTISLSNELGEGNGYMGYRITTSPKGVIIYGHDERGIAQGLYYVEDLLKLRRAPFLSFGTVERKALFTPRITQSPIGMYEYPEECFAHIAHAGMDAIEIWLRDESHDLRDRYIDLNAICTRAKKWGIDVYIELYAPHDAHPLEEGAQEFYDNLYGKIFDVCPSIRGIMVEGESTNFKSRDERVGLSPHSENFVDNIPTGKISPGWFPCRDYPEWITMIRDAVRKKSSTADVVFCTYNWGFVNEKDRIDLIRALPEDICLLVTYEMFQRYNLKGVTESICDYSLSFTGPGEYFLSEANVAKEKGLKLYSITNTSGKTWDFGAIPFEPMPMQWLKRYENILSSREKFGLCGLWENIHYGFYPSFISDLEKQMFFSPVQDSTNVLLKVLTSHFGEDAKSVYSALEQFSKGITHYVPTNEDQYGGFRIGPSYPLWSGELKALPSGIPNNGKIPAEEGVMFGNGIYFGEYTPDYEGRNSLPGLRIRKEISSIKKMLSLFQKGYSILKDIPKKEESTERLQNMIKFLINTCKTVINVKKHFILKQKLSIEKSRVRSKILINKMEKILLHEKQNVLDTFPIVQVDSTLGYEHSMGYVTDERCLNWKLRQLDYELNTKIPSYRNSIK